MGAGKVRLNGGGGKNGLKEKGRKNKNISTKRKRGGGGFRGVRKKLKKGIWGEAPMSNTKRTNPFLKKIPSGGERKGRKREDNVINREDKKGEC